MTGNSLCSEEQMCMHGFVQIFSTSARVLGKDRVC